jgi:peptide/nickel transport system permease protein
MVAVAIAAPLIALHSPTEIKLTASLTPPFWDARGSLNYPLGTDLLGRDIFSRVVYGARISLAVAFPVILLGGGFGTAVGLLSGYLGRTADTVLMRTADAALAMPTVVVALVCAVAFGQSFQSVVAAISIALWARFARVVRAETLSLRERDFVAYARVAGHGPLSIMVRHILPNLIHSLIVLVTVQVGGVILLEASLSFIGSGVPAPAASWGRMIADGQGHLATAWWISAFPAVMIALTVLAFNLLGDWASDNFNPRLKF